jgi:hypothetical protein
MKLIEGLKKIKDLQRKAQDLRVKVSSHSAYLSHETPVYENQKQQVSEWIQAHSDVLKEIMKLRVGIQKTNIQTLVTIDINGKPVEKSIAEWIHRRRDLAGLEREMWDGLGDRGLREGIIEQSTGEKVEVKIVRCYDPKERDSNREIYTSEPVMIDSRLEITNATTDIIE